MTKPKTTVMTLGCDVSDGLILLLRLGFTAASY